MTDDLIWHVPPSCQGQIVEYAYASDVENQRYLCRVHDKAGFLETTIYECPFDKAPDVVWEPWNREPEIPDDDWT
jgi:hypothetical protein